MGAVVSDTDVPEDLGFPTAVAAFTWVEELLTPKKRGRGKRR